MKDVIITLGALTYNTKEETVPCFKALLEEAKALSPLVGTVRLVMYDNGSDGTKEECAAFLKSNDDLDYNVTVQFLGRGYNYGQSHGRNQIIESEPDSDYFFLIDGDIQVVPGSVYNMLTYMAQRPRLGCLCPHPTLQTINPDVATKRMNAVGNIRNDVRSACTGYALYRAEVFSKIQFEERGPFWGPGWGLEDDDMWLQLTTAGWNVDYFTGIMYLQRKPRASWGPLRQAGVDVVKRFEERKAFFMDKWKQADPGILSNVRGQNIRIPA